VVEANTHLSLAYGQPCATIARAGGGGQAFESLNALALLLYLTIHIIPPMYIGVFSHKGGVGKTTTAIHIAAILNESAPTLLINSDANRSAIELAKNARSPFKVVDTMTAERHVSGYKNVIFDTAARPTPDQLKALIEDRDHLLMIVEPEPN
jgi:Mrp family chromosome partitioning ATPase